MDDPFGWKVLTKDSVYAAPNRFFVHFYIYNFFRTVPSGLQTFMNPIDSIYTTAAISKTLIHILLIVLLAGLVSGTDRVYDRNFLIAAAIITPLFQTGGHFYKYIGIVDQSITYSSFYALPISLLILFLKPYINWAHGRKIEFSIFQLITMGILLMILPFSGPLIPGIVLVIAFLGGGYFLLSSIEKRPSGTKQRIPGSMLLLLLVLVLLSLYSIYIGQNNLESQSGAEMSLIDRYARLPKGLFYMLTQKLGYPLLLLMIGINIFIHKKQNKDSKQLMRMFYWILLFVLIYLLLLPMGGFREYRPFILRKDTFLPVALLLVYFFAYSSYLVIQRLRFNYKRYYLGILTLFLLIFTLADEVDSETYQCEKALLFEISESEDKIIKLPSTCTILSWEVIKNPGDSEEQSELLYFWKITDEKKAYYQE